MNFSGGITITFHSIVLIINWFIKKPIHFIITLIVLWFFVSWFLFFSRMTLIGNNVSNINNYHICYKKIKIEPDKKYIILRLDDIQWVSLRDITFKMLNEWFKRKIPFTLGIIPLNISKDTLMTAYLQENSCYIEIAQHGFNHRNDIPEFQDLPESIVMNKLKQWLGVLKKLTDKEIITFIPPENIYSTWTSIWAKKIWFKIISWEWNWFFDYSVSTFNYDKLRLNTISSIVNKSNVSADNKGFSVVMLHPQDYVDKNWKLDNAKYNEYLKLLDYLEEQWFLFTTIYDYYNYLDQIWKADEFYDRNVTWDNSSKIVNKNIDYVFENFYKKEEIKLISN